MLADSQLVPLADWRPRFSRQLTPSQQLTRFVARQLGLRKVLGKEFAKVRGRAMVTPLKLHQLDLDPASHAFFVGFLRCWLLALVNGDAELERRLFRALVDDDELPRWARDLPPWTARYFPPES